MKQREAFDKIQHELELAQNSIVALVNEGYTNKNKKTFAQLTPQEFSQACDLLKIDKQTGRFRLDDPNNKKTPEKKTSSIWDWFRKARQGGSTVLEQQDETAKWQTEEDAGSATSNEGGGAAPEEKVKQESQDYRSNKPEVSKDPKAKKKKSKAKTPDLQPSFEDTEDEVKQEQRGFDSTSMGKGSNKRVAPPAPRRTSPRKKTKKS